MRFVSVACLFPSDSAVDHRKEKHFMLKHFCGCTLVLALAMLGIVQPLAYAWACDPCPQPIKPYAPDVPPERPYP